MFLFYQLQYLCAFVTMLLKDESVKVSQSLYQ